MEELKMSIDEMISTLDGASGTVEALINPKIREAKEMIMKVSIALGELSEELEESAYLEIDED